MAKKKKVDPKEQYERKKAQELKRNRERNRLLKEVGPLPKVRNPYRKRKALKSFLNFLLAYAQLSLEFSSAHLEAINRFEDLLENGGSAALAMPRGWGKTTLCQWAAIYAILSGKRKYGVYVGATQEEAEERLEEIKEILQGNPLLQEDFPEVCYPIKMLDGTNQRAKTQTLNGKRTNFEWGGNKSIKLPTVARSKASGAKLIAKGITSAIRGKKKTNADGTDDRPDFAVIDDPQTDEGAQNPDRVFKIMKIINGAILRLGNGLRKFAAFLPCTVIQKNDVADQVLNRDKSPEWRGQITKALDALPTNEKIWNEYSDVLFVYFVVF